MAPAARRLWVLGNFSRFVRPNYKRIDVKGADDVDTLAATAFLAPDGKQMVVVIVNSSFESRRVRLELPKQWQRRVQSVKSYRTDARHDLTYAELNSSLAYDVPMRGVTTLVIDL